MHGCAKSPRCRGSRPTAHRRVHLGWPRVRAKGSEHVRPASRASEVDSALDRRRLGPSARRPDEKILYALFERCADRQEPARFVNTNQFAYHLIGLIRANDIEGCRDVVGDKLHILRENLVNVIQRGIAVDIDSDVGLALSDFVDRPDWRAALGQRGHYRDFQKDHDDRQ